MTTITQKPQAAPHRKSRAIAVGSTVLATSLVWITAHLVGVSLRVDQHDGQGPQAIGLLRVAGFTLVASLLGWAALSLMERYTKRAITAWTILAFSVLLLSFAPILLVGASLGTKITLALIHLTVAAILTPTLRRTAQPGPR